MALTGMFMLLTWVNLVTATIYAGDWIRVAITGPDCDVTMYGAVGDSVTDDTVTGFLNLHITLNFRITQLMQCRKP